LDDDRYADLESLVQHRYDDPSKRRRIQRLTPSATPVKQAMSASDSQIPTITPKSTSAVALSPPSSPAPSKPASSSSSSSSSSGESIKWYWKADKGFVPFSDDICLKLEDARKNNEGEV